MGSRGQVSGNEGGPWGSDLTSFPDLHDHALGVAQLAAAANEAERLDAAYARLERRLDRIAVSMAGLDNSPVISPGQLRLVVGE